MKYFFLLLFIPVFCFNCSSTDETNIAKPVNIEFFETYNIDEISPIWFAACDSLKPDVNLRNLVQLNPSFAFGTVTPGNLQTVETFLKSQEINNFFPKDLEFMLSLKPEDVPGRGTVYVLYAVKIPEDGRAMIRGKHIKQASRGLNTQTGENTINLVMTDNGINDWSLMTARNVGRSIAITVDGKVLSCPMVREAINGGTTEISGNFTREEADELTAGINAGH